MQPAPTNGNRAEAMEMLFDPAETSSRLLEFFFQIRDPTTLDHQGSDHGSIAMRMWKRESPRLLRRPFRLSHAAMA